MLRVSKLTPVAIALLFLPFAPMLRDTLAQQQKPMASANSEIEQLNGEVSRSALGVLASNVQCHANIRAE
jgi:hypothetical protein